MKNRKRKIIILILFILIIVLIFKFDNKKDSDLRFRIIANSNSSYDQSIKIKVKDELFKDMNIFNNTDLDIIKSKCEYILKGLNVTYNVNVNIEKQRFESKYFNNELIKGGEYNTLVIRLGEALGKNYFTILCPKYFNIGYEEINSGDVQYKVWIWEEIKRVLCK